MNDEASKISMRNQDRSIELLGEYTGKLLSRLDRINELVRRSFSLAAMLAAILSALASSGIFYIETVRSSSVEIERYFGPFIIGCLGILLVSLLAILSTRFSRNSYFYQSYEINDTSMTIPVTNTSHKTPKWPSASRRGGGGSVR